MHSKLSETATRSYKKIGDWSVQGRLGKGHFSKNIDTVIKHLSCPNRMNFPWSEIEAALPETLNSPLGLNPFKRDVLRPMQQIAKQVLKLHSRSSASAYSDWLIPIEGSVLEGKLSTVIKETKPICLGPPCTKYLEQSLQIFDLMSQVGGGRPNRFASLLAILREPYADPINIKDNMIPQLLERPEPLAIQSLARCEGLLQKTESAKVTWKLLEKLGHRPTKYFENFPVQSLRPGRVNALRNRYGLDVYFLLRPYVGDVQSAKSKSAAIVAQDIVDTWFDLVLRDMPLQNKSVDRLYKHISKVSH